jgi:hypothetical protein
LRENETPKLLFASNKDHKFVPFVKVSYQYAWEAQKDAVKMLRRAYHVKLINRYKKEAQDSTRPVIMDIAAEQMLINHYVNLLGMMEDLSRGAKGEKESEEDAKKQVDMIVSELEGALRQVKEKKYLSKLVSLLRGFKKLRRKYFGVKETKTAALKEVDDAAVDELLYDYGQRVCEAVQEYHKGAICFVHHSRNGGEIVIKEIKDVNGEEDDLYETILKVRVNENANVDIVIPYGRLSRLYPFYSVEFYQRYWKPIIESIGHFYLDDANVLLVPEKSPLPDISNGEDTHTLEGWNLEKNGEEKVDISFRGEKPIWIFEASRTTKTAKVQSKYTEQDYLNSVVKCIDSNLESIHGRTGAVIQIIPLTDMIELDVDFGRGLGIVRLTEDQVEII